MHGRHQSHIKIPVNPICDLAHSLTLTIMSTSCFIMPKWPFTAHNCTAPRKSWDKKHAHLHIIHFTWTLCMYSIKSVKASQETLEAIEQFPHNLLALDVLNHQLSSFSCLLQFIMSSRSLCCFFSLPYWSKEFIVPSEEPRRHFGVPGPPVDIFRYWSTG